MRHSKLKLFLLVAATTCAVVSGCSGPRGAVIEGPADWSRGGVTLALPEGVWLVESHEGNGTGGWFSVFTRREGVGRITFWRVSTPSNAPPWLTLQDFFLEFREKCELGRWTLKMRNGREADCAAFLLQLDGRRVYATACAVKDDFTTYVVIAWGFGKGHSPSRRVAEAVTASLCFPGEEP